MPTPAEYEASAVRKGVHKKRPARSSERNERLGLRAKLLRHNTLHKPPAFRFAEVHANRAISMGLDYSPS